MKTLYNFKIWSVRLKLGKDALKEILEEEQQNADKANVEREVNKKLG